MRRISIINQKGGVGKTTTTTNLGAACGRAGLRTLLIDLDPQAHLTLHFNVEIADDQKTVYDVLTSATPLSDVIVSIGDNVKIVPSDTDLAGAEAELIAVPGREVILREAVDAVADQFDVLLIDCPPALGVLTLNALTATNEVIIPLQAQFFALQGLGQLLNTVSLVRQRINPNIIVSGMIFCMHESATRLAGEVESDLAQFLDGARGSDVPWSHARIYETRIRRNIKLAEASSYGQSVFDYAPKSKGSIDYETLTREVFNLPKPPAVKQPVATKAPTVPTNGRIPATSSKPAKPTSDVSVTSLDSAPSQSPDNHIATTSTNNNTTTTSTTAATDVTDTTPASVSIEPTKLEPAKLEPAKPNAIDAPKPDAPKSLSVAKPIRKKPIAYQEPAIEITPVASPAPATSSHT